MLAIEEGARAQELALCGCMTNLSAAQLGIDNPDDLRAAGKEVFEPFIDFRPGVVRRENLHCEVGRAGEELPTGRLEAQILESGLRDERNIRRAAISVAHPKTGAGIPDCAQLMRSIEVHNVGEQSRADLAMERIIFRTHDKFTINHLVGVTVSRKSLQFSFRPNRLSRISYRDHDDTLNETKRSV